LQGPAPDRGFIWSPTKRIRPVLHLTTDEHDQIATRGGYNGCTASGVPQARQRGSYRHGLAVHRAKQKVGLVTALAETQSDIGNA